MSAADDLLQRALQLPQHERVGLVRQLILSLDSVDIDNSKEEGYDEACAAELSRRMASIQSGEFKATPWREALEEIKAAAKSDQAVYESATARRSKERSGRSSPLVRTPTSGLSVAFTTELQIVLDAIAADPQRFAEIESPIPEGKLQRHRFNRFPYIVVYHVLPDEVLVVAIFHTSRKPNYWKQRLG